MNARATIRTRVIGCAGYIGAHFVPQLICALVHGRLSETYSLGSSISLSNLDVIEEIKPLTNDIWRNVRIEYYPERAFDVKANVLDSTKFRIKTGWVPQIKFEDGLCLTRDWLRSVMQ